MVSSTITG